MRRLRPPRLGFLWLGVPRVRDPRTLASIAAAAVLVAIAAAAVVSGRAPDAISLVDTSPTPSPPAAVAPATFAPITSLLPDVTPIPSGQLAAGVDAVQETSVPVQTVPPATPTPAPDPALWRFEGVVIDPAGDPIQGVCVIIGPRGCRPAGIRTDDRGAYYVDLPQDPTVPYTFYFEKYGFTTVMHRAKPSGPTVFNVVLRPG